MVLDYQGGKVLLNHFTKKVSLVACVILFHPGEELNFRPVPVLPLSAYQRQRPLAMVSGKIYRQR